MPSVASPWLGSLADDFVRRRIPPPAAAAGSTLRSQRRRRALHPRRVGIAWGLLVLDALTFYPGSVLPSCISRRMGKGITQGALALALLLAAVNRRRIIVRPNVFLCLVSLLVVESITSLQPSTSVPFTGPSG